MTPRCLSCGPSANVIKDGITRHGRQRYRCTRCDSQVHARKSASTQNRAATVAGRIEVGRGYVWDASA